MKKLSYLISMSLLSPSARTTGRASPPPWWRTSPRCRTRWRPPSGGSSSNRCCCDDRRIGADGAERGGKPSRREAEADFLRVGGKPPRDAPNRSAKISWPGPGRRIFPLAIRRETGYNNGISASAELKQIKEVNCVVSSDPLSRSHTVPTRRTR